MTRGFGGAIFPQSNRINSNITYIRVFASIIVMLDKLSYNRWLYDNLVHRLAD